jgi:orotidine-5'-phosphate decarboxylase
MTMDSVHLVLGIDPFGDSFAEFERSLDAHRTFLSHPSLLFSARVSWIKPNLSFFLKHGSAGLKHLEKNVAAWREHFQVIVDAKFSEIDSSLSASLHYVFQELKADAVTLNPFLGENSIELATRACSVEKGEKGLVFVLCQTSQQSKGPLAYLQADPNAIVKSALEIQKTLFKETSPQKVARLGLVVGANHLPTFSEKLSLEHRSTNIPLLAPGLGAQGADEMQILASAFTNPCFFPVSRGIFQGGEATQEEMQNALKRYSTFADKLRTKRTAAK